MKKKFLLVVLFTLVIVSNPLAEILQVTMRVEGMT
jgi:hypothetical protein